MRLEDYDIQLIVKSDKDVLNKRTLPIEIEDKKYTFRIFRAKNAIMEFGLFLNYSSLKDSDGPIERSLNEMIYSSNIIDYERFFSENFFFEPEFFIDDEKYTLRIAGEGPIALILLMDLTYAEINSSNRPIEKKLRNFIVSTYKHQMNINPDLKNKFEKVLENEKEKEKRKEERLTEVREKEKKIHEIEDEFDFYKPRDKSRYKIR